MKPSMYNYVIERDNLSYWYNGVNHTYFLLPLELGRKVERILQNSDEIELLPKNLLNKLQNGGFLISNEFNEIEYIRKKNNEKINQKDYLLILLPTLNCNFKCWYCIQDHIVSSMSPETMSDIKKHIEYMIKTERITSLHIEWFGGEPLMYFKQIIKPMCEYAQILCNKNNISYLSSATTNGYFLTADILDDIKQLNFRRFHITLDGAKEYHDKVKFQNNCASTFDHVLGNIENLLNNSSDIQIILRINYTDKNLDYQIVEDINKIISKKNRKRIQINPKKVWQETVCKERYASVNALLDLFEESGYGVTRLDIIWDFIPCYANRKYYNAINYNGDVLKCTASNELYEQKNHGTITENGSILWDESFIKKYQAKSFENPNCLACKYLPICMGICPRDYGSRSYCKLNGMDIKVEDSLVHYINTMNKIHSTKSK